MNKYLTGASLIAVSAVFCSGAQAQVDQIVVTATKRAENAQDVPVAVQALGEKSLDELRVDNFNDYLAQLPGVTAGGSGPGQNTIYIRGIASTTPNLTTAGVAGLAPNVALYLDEQPLAQPGRNLDVYAVDLERVEVLPGPQGTLFGASSQAGTVRLITNKPRLGEYEASFAAGVETTKGGELSKKFEGMVNVPLSESLALRVVGYLDQQGGYIDNVAGVRDASDSARFRPEGTVRANGVPVSAGRAGFQSTDDLSGVTFLEANNNALVEEDFNNLQYAGMRISALYEINDDWRVTVGHARQDIESEGVFFADPELDDYEIQRFEDDNIEDDFNNTSWTIEGRLGALEVLYTGAYTDRDTQQTVDYTDYLFVGQYLPDYICDYSVVYPAGDPMGTCQPPNLRVNSTTQTQVFTHELRFNTPKEKQLRATVGGFYRNLEIAERNDFVYPGALAIINSDSSVGIGSLPPNFPLTNGAATAGQIGKESDFGYFSDPGPFPDEVIFRNDVLRTDKQFGFFGEINFDVVPDTLTLTFGTRYYDIEVDLEGSANSAFDRLFPTTDTNGDPVESQCCGTNISAQFAPGNPFGAPDAAKTDGFIFKGNISWTPTDDVLLYATYSEGFRPGLLNRPGGAAGPGGYTVPYAIDTDEVTNYEIGWKAQLFDNQLQFNGNAFYVDIERLQTTIFDPSIVNLFFSDNAANAEIVGVEGDIIWAPASIDGLTVSSAFSVLDTEIKEVLTPTNDVTAGAELAFAPSFQGNIRARYEWDVSTSARAHFQAQVVHSGSAYSDIIEINKAYMDDWTTFGASLGVRNDRWSIEVYGENLGNSYGVLANNFVYDRERITVLRPRTIGVRVGLSY